MGWSLPHRSLGEQELLLYADLSDDRDLQIRYLASRLAAKEAAVKALRLPKDQDTRELQILNDSMGAPHVLYKNNTYPVSISDCGTHVAAVVLSQKEIKE